MFYCLGIYKNTFTREHGISKKSAYGNETDIIINTLYKRLN